MPDTITLTTTQAQRLLTILDKAADITSIKHDARDMWARISRLIELADMKTLAVVEPAANIELPKDVPPISVVVVAPEGNPAQLEVIDCYQVPAVGETVSAASRRWRVTRVHWQTGAIAELYVEPPADGWDDGGGF